MKRINLLPQEQRVKASRERGMIWAILLLVAVVAALGLVYFKLSSDVGAKQDELNQINAEMQVTEAKLAELRPYGDLQNQRTAMTETGKAIYATSVPFSTILQELSLVIPDNVRLQTLEVLVPPAMVPGPVVAPTTGTAPATTVDITFTGLTLQHRDVAEFMTRLGLIPQLMNIHLGGSTSVQSTTSTTSGSTTQTTANIQFTVNASLRPYLQAPPTTVLEGETAQ